MPAKLGGRIQLKKRQARKPTLATSEEASSRRLVFASPLEHQLSHQDSIESTAAATSAAATTTTQIVKMISPVARLINVANGNEIDTSKRNKRKKTTHNNKMISKLNLTAIVLVALTCCQGSGNQPRSGDGDNNHRPSGSWLAAVVAQSIDHQQQQQQQQTSELINYQNQLALLTGGQDNLLSEQPMQRQASGSPPLGHYEFEVAPKLEPPRVRKPPYKASLLTCAGADPLDGFSPRNTLCGDLNQGYIPLNPLGQNVADQSYPFEVIKNKTLQFLARALPFLRLESETIPQVFRYMPSNQLLNPTHSHSPLASKHMSQLNQRVGGPQSPPAQQQHHHHQLNVMSPMDSAALNGFIDNSVPYLRRRKRHSLTQITVAELSPNATLVVSSAHSPGKIGHQRYHPNHQLAPTSASSHSMSPSSGSAIDSNVAVVTKDGFKAVNGAHVVVTNRQQQQQNQQQHEHAATSTVANTNGKSFGNLPAENNGGQSHEFAKRAAGLSSMSGSNGANNGNSRRVNQSALQTHANLATQASSAAAPQIGTATTAAKLAHQSESRQLDSAAISVTAQAASGHGHHQRTSGSTASTVPSASGQVQARSSGGSVGESIGEFVAPKSQSNGQETQARSAQEKATESMGSQQQQQQARETHQQKTERKRSGGCEGSNAWTSAICKAAAALIEPGEPAPAWLQIAKHLSAAYSGASDTMDRAPIWSLLSSALVPQESAQNNAKSADMSGKANSLAYSARQNLISMLNPLVSLLTSAPPTPKDSSGVRHAPQANSGNDHGATSSSALTNPKEQQVGTLANAIVGVALTGWATNAITSLVQYFMPNAFQTARSSFSRRKKPFESGEQFVDTPASLMAAASATSGIPHLTGGGGGGSSSGTTSKQPPTPCPSVEEYISPTFARNYQGQWKYVVQIPAEGYFTQTIQRTSCARQKCEFTEGVCHESPRWVSLLVAEIYYPDAIVGAPGQASIEDAMAGSVGQQMAASSRHYQQMAMHQQLPVQQQQQQQPHPQPQMQAKSSSMAANAQDLQMTDSLNAYEHNNLQAMLNAANEMGLDPTNANQMRQLANNYQLMQRYGSVPQQSVQQQQVSTQQAYQAHQQQVAESRSSPSIVNAQGQVVGGGSSLFNGYSNEQILSLAAALLQQNPNMNINDLIANIQMQTSLAHRRKRRDVVVANRPQQQVAPPTGNSQQHVAAQFSNYKPSVTQIQQAAEQQAANAVANAQQSPSASDQMQLAQGQAVDGQAAQPAATTADGSQECDGRDKFGCYVVRVYYDWFLVNGSCKCWKTTSQSSGASDRQQQTGNSFLRRIFTG